MSTLTVTMNELERAGIAYTVTRTNGNHYRVKADGLPLIVCSVTCSDRRGEIIARSLVRRYIRQNGLGAVA